MEKFSEHVLVYHGNCPDGSTSGILARNIDNAVALIPGIHYKIDAQIAKAARDLKKNGVLWICDIACDEKTLIEVIKILANKSARLEIFEHHETRKYLETFVIPEGKNVSIYFDQSRCGSAIFYDVKCVDYPELKKYHDLISIVNDRDLWINKDERGVEFANLHDIYGDEKYIERFFKNPSVELKPEEKILLEFKKQKESNRNEKLLEKIEIGKDDRGFEYGVMYGEASGSDLLNLAIFRFDLEYAVLINMNTGRASIRSKGNFDCAAFSQKKGGGGHVAASGFKVPVRYPTIY